MPAIPKTENQPPLPISVWAVFLAALGLAIVAAAANISLFSTRGGPVSVVNQFSSPRPKEHLRLGRKHGDVHFLILAQRLGGAEIMAPKGYLEKSEVIKALSLSLNVQAGSHQAQLPPPALSRLQKYPYLAARMSNTAVMKDGLQIAVIIFPSRTPKADLSRLYYLVFHKDNLIFVPEQVYKTILAP